MSFKSYKFAFVLTLISLSNILLSQITTHNISTGIVTDCRAKFYDDGGITLPYQILGSGSGGTYTFQIVTGNPVITMTFNPLPTATQITIGDNITFYRQFPLIPANIISGPYTNVPTTTTISPVVSNTGSLIVVWHENGNTNGIGWDAGWSSPAVAPAPPTYTINPIPLCNATQIKLDITNGILCDSLKPNQFVINGPMFPGISTVIATPCSSGTTTSVQLNLINPLNKNCTYTLTSNFYRKDKCDSVYSFPNIVTTFSIGNCPVQGSITTLPTNTVCAYNCSTTLTAVTPATTCLTFNYSWNNGLPPTPGPHIVCPTITTVYTCTLTETTTLTQSIISNTVYVTSPHITPLINDTICQTIGTFYLNASPSGGVWSGPGITPSNTLTGLFNPYASGPGTFNIIYNFGGCRDTITITVLALAMGSTQAGCTGGPPFQLISSPLGGTWSGSPFVSASGSFTPSIAGSYTVNYTFGGCTGTKTVNVSNIIVPTTTHTLCQSAPYEYLYPLVSPFGGIFTGTGITQAVLGAFTPTALGGTTSTITYSLSNGCNASFSVSVIPVYAFPTITTCPSQAPFTVPTATPTGGFWIGTGITNSITGMYNPAMGGVTSHTDILIYQATNGCRDTTKINSTITTIVNDSLFLCDNIPSFKLNNYPVFNYFPLGGTFTSTSPGLTFSAGNYYFDPSLSGQGIHTVYYNANTCSDSIKIIIYPSSLSGYDSTICSSHPPFIVAPMPFGTTWSGTGITNPSTGLFDPSSTGTGTFTLTYTNKGGCSDNVTMIVYPFVAANITGLSSNYCYTNSNHILTCVPPSGTLTTTWAPTTYTFNAATVGAGTYTTSYYTGTGSCYTVKTITTTVSPQLTTSLTVSKNVLCLDEASNVTVTGYGGLPTVVNYTYTWSHGLLPLNHQVLHPTTTTVYTVITSDNCSDPKIDTIRIFVHPNFYPSITLSPKKCYYEPGFAAIAITPSGGNYSYLWNSVPAQTTATLNGFSGKNYSVIITNTLTGCSRDTVLKIPGYNPIEASFSANPNLPCIPMNLGLVSFIDYSKGATGGTWNFNGDIVPYDTNKVEQYLFSDPGEYTIILNIYNEGNCKDSASITICISPADDIFVPDIFSPNGDGANDVFYVRGKAINELHLLIYDRWGEKVFESFNKDDGWDGTFKGKQSESAVYYYYLEATLNDSKKITKKGDITVTR